MSLKIEVTGVEQLRQLDEQLRRSPRKTLLDIAQNVLLPGIKSQYHGGGFAQLSAATLDIRKRYGVTSTTPLDAGGAFSKRGGYPALADSFKARATDKVGAAGAAWPAAALRKGFTTGAGSWIPGRTVPAREFVFMDDRMADVATDKLADLYSEESPE